MNRTPSGNGWCALGIRRGEYPYDTDAVQETLQGYLAQDQEEKPMIVIRYGPEGTPVSDFEIEAALEDILSRNPPFTIAFSTNNIFDRVRLGIARGEISHEHVKFGFGDEYINLDEDGCLLTCPDGFCDLGLRQAFAMMDEREGVSP